MASGGGSIATTITQFATKGGGKECTTKDMTKWCKDGKVFGKNCTSTNMDIAFSKCRNKTTKNIGVNEVDALCCELAATYMKDHTKVESKEAAVEEIKGKLAGASKDLASGTTKQSKTGGVDKMTDASKYTGAHKSRFGADGKGKGIDGREERSENTGYTGQYKGEGTHASKSGKK